MNSDWLPGDTNRKQNNMAVMEHRTESPDAIDDFPTPPWATRAICERLNAIGFKLDNKMAWEPACGRGFMVRPMEEFFPIVLATDAFDYCGTLLFDFLFSGFGDGQHANVIMTNPP